MKSKKVSTTSLRLSEADKSRLVSLSLKYGMNISELIRYWIHNDKTRI